LHHSTGAEKRLDREGITGFSFFGGETYSKEELVAEITASGMLGYLGIDTEKSFRNNTAYIQSWLKVLRNDKKMIVSASSKAEKALKYIMGGDV
jgi:antirestriction protein ArdC